jgi:glucose-6-phosphate isomerase
MHSASDLLTRWPALDIASKRARLLETFHLAEGPLSPALASGAAAAARTAERLWRRDPGAWSEDPAVQHQISNRLGWLDSPLAMVDAIPRLESFGASIKAAGFTDVVLLGMGGSSLAPEVLRAVLGPSPGWLRLHVLDSTDPAAIESASTPPERTLYVVASKSGTTIEPNTLAAYFRDRLKAAVTAWADHFVAITDEDTELARRARAERFRDLFINPSDIGGRYSALSFFGLVPAALMGLDLRAILGWGVAMLAVAEELSAASANPAVALGWAMAAAAREGRDKLTVLLPPSLEPFGLWVEQLVAESTGKQGTGIVPICGEPQGAPPAYGHDRFFARVRLRRSYEEELRDADVHELERAGHPVARVDLVEPAALGAEFVRWEVATAVAGALLRINPFDEPNVQQAKDATRALLEQYRMRGRLPTAEPDFTLDSGTALTLTRVARAALAGRPDSFLTLVAEGDYLALLPYVGPDPRLVAPLRSLRATVRDTRRAATMFAYGPRYLHSTGQLHKGGPKSGVFILMTAAPNHDLPVPGEPFSFGTLELAQALGDFASLDAGGCRALHVHLPSPEPRVVQQVADRLLQSTHGAAP